MRAVPVILQDGLGLVKARANATFRCELAVRRFGDGQPAVLQYTENVAAAMVTIRGTEIQRG